MSLQKKDQKEQDQKKQVVMKESDNTLSEKDMLMITGGGVYEPGIVNFICWHDPR